MDNVPKIITVVGIGTIALLALTFMWRQAQLSTETLVVNASGGPVREFNIVTLLPFDGIAAISEPEFLSLEEAEGLFHPDDLVIGVEINGDARAYGVAKLSSHEIVNDIVGGRPIAVTW